MHKTKLFELKKVSQSKLALRADISRQQLDNILKGKSLPPLSTARRIASQACHLTGLEIYEPHDFNPSLPPATCPSAPTVTDTAGESAESLIISSPYRCCFTSQFGVFTLPLLLVVVDDDDSSEATGVELTMMVLLNEDVVCDGVKA